MPKIKPYLSVNFCYKCKRPVPRMGLSIRGNAGNVSVSTPFMCPWCKSENRKNKR